MSSGASFVKRSKPRSSASRISSTYDDGEEDATAGTTRLGPSTGAFSELFEQGSSRSSTPRRTMSGPDVDEEDEAGGTDVVFRPRARGMRGKPSSSAASTSKGTQDQMTAPALKPRTSIASMDEDEEVQDGGSTAFEIRRSKLSIAGKQARRTAATGLSSASTSTPKRSIPLRPTSFAAQPSEDNTASETGSTMYTSKYLEELRSSTPTSRSRAHSPTTIGPGTRIDDPMVAQTSRISLIDDDSLARSKFPADFSHDAIPSESVIKAAKEKRAKLRAAAATASDDYISLGSSSSALKAYDRMEVDDGPHPHSRLQREEDEFGDGEEEFAEYTGATERIPIGEKAEKEWKARQREEMKSAVTGDLDGELEEMDEDEMAWERAQLNRTQPVSQTSREKSPFRPAPIPASAPLPSVSTCSTRLQLTLRALEQSTAASEAVLNSTRKELEALEEAERENKLDVVAVEEKASWFGELDEFVASLARFMEEKVGKVEEVEREAMELLKRRKGLVGKRRGVWLGDRLEACFGIRPTFGVIPDLTEEEDEDMRTIDATDSITAIPASQLDQLKEADQLSFVHAQRSIVSQLTAIFSDVQAVEYLDPAATTLSSGLPFHTATSSQNVEGDLHPRSVVSRFSEFRRRYPEQYAQVWGGLSVAQIWEFYARLELILWDPFCSSSSLSTGWKAGCGETVAQMRWFTSASDYTSSSSGEVMGGDDEVLQSIVANVLVEKLNSLAEKDGAFDAWSRRASMEVVEGVDLVQTVLGGGHGRCQALMEAYLGVFRGHIERLVEVVSPQSRRGAVALDGGAKQAADEVVEELMEGLLQNLLRWSKVIDFTASNGAVVEARKTFVGLVERLVMDVIVPFFGSVMQSEGQLAKKHVFDMIPKNVVAASERLTALSRQL
ncbi:uncharacterized protein UTRI_00838_B [Ustilago trichophora]|uniref:Uncharacterized protein n=1 Tax=Ustilago trichophora TaxID=86804 RepID=A0A5C3DS84_9BASI|nr:uncharacterized protein UTRI_00838_B [Ustilago trichophora]